MTVDRKNSSDQLEAEIVALKAENEKLRAAMKEAKEELYEINLSNYDEDEISRLNQGSVSAYLILQQALE